MYQGFTPLQTYKVLKLYLTFLKCVYCFTPLQTYKVLKPISGNSKPVSQFYTFTNLQGSQTCSMGNRKRCSFTPLQTYKVLKRFITQSFNLSCFTPLQTYKVLKRYSLLIGRPTSFTPLQTYKVLKHITRRISYSAVLHLYKLTRFSNSRPCTHKLHMFYTFTNLQGSQTFVLVNMNTQWFYTFTNLQGSQTPIHQSMNVLSFTPLQTYKVLKPFSLRVGHSFCFTPLQTYKVLKPITAIVIVFMVLHLYKLTRFSNN